MKLEDVEYAILSACLISDVNEQCSVMRLIVPELPSDRFTKERQIIYDAILNRWVRAGSVDVITLAEELGSNLKKVGGATELNYIQGSLERLALESVEGLRQWCQVVDRAGRIRQASLVARKYANKLDDVEAALIEIEDVDEFVARFAAELRQVQSREGGLYEPVGQHVERWRQTLDLRAENLAPIDWLPSGWNCWDGFISGIPLGGVTVLCGLPSTGKTQLALQLAYNIANWIKQENEKGCILFNSLEMTGEMLMERLACALAEVDSRQIRLGRVGKDSMEYKRLMEATKHAQKIPLHIDDSDYLTSELLDLRASTYHMEYGPVRLIVVDFVALVQDERNESEELRISGIYRKAKSLAKNLGAAVLVLAQYNRQVGERPSKLGGNFDIRYSGMAWIAADLILHIYNPWQIRQMGIECYPPKEYPVEKETAYLLVGKNKNGPTGYWRMRWVPQFTYWGDIEEEDDF